MKSVRLSPHCDLSASGLCLGLASIGTKNTEAEAFSLMDRYVEAGGDFFDNARIYSDWVPGERGRSERIFGDWLKRRGSAEGIVISTKGGHPPLGRPGESRLTASELKRDVELSLAAMGVERIDLYWLHRDDPSRGVEELLSAANALVEAGKLRHLGASNWTGPRLADANELARREGLEGFVASQPFWAVGSQDARKFGDASMVSLDLEGYLVCQKGGVALIPYSSQANGYFTKMTSENLDSAQAAQSSVFNTEQNRTRAPIVKEIAQRHGCSVNAVVLGYLTSHEATVLPVVGPSSMEHLNASLQDYGLQLSRDELLELDSPFAEAAF